MRWALFLLVLAALGGCAPAAGLVAADVASVTVFGRGLTDIGVSAITGRDCSVVRLDAGKTYCAPVYLGPPVQPICTRSIGVVDCWAEPSAVPPGALISGFTPPPLVDQLRYRSERWPKDLLF
ncbi:MAG: hypothetical protein RQ966_10175 [Acetobacteraceae bacterium]|nr:hypothetical protein [Acetobacteraceae bacterium]